MVMFTRGVCRMIPRFFAIALAEVTTPLAMRPGPPSFSLAKTKIVSPLAMCLPPYIVFWALNVKVSVRGSLTSALTANMGLGLTRHKMSDGWRERVWLRVRGYSHGKLERGAASRSLLCLVRWFTCHA